MRHRLLFVIHKEGASDRRSSLYRSTKRTVDTLNRFGIESMIGCCYKETLGVLIYEAQPTDVILEEYQICPELLQSLKTLYPTVQFITRMYADTPIETDAGVRLPSLYPIGQVRPKSKAVGDGDIHVGCVGPVRPGYHHVEQAQAAIRYAIDTHRKLMFHVEDDSGSCWMGGLRALFDRHLSHTLITHSKWTHDIFKTQIDVLLDCSPHIATCLDTLDAVVAGVPVVGSSSSDWLGTHSQADVKTPGTMVAKLHRILDGSEEDRDFYTWTQWCDIKAFYERSLSIWVQTFGNVIEKREKA